MKGVKRASRVWDTSEVDCARRVGVLSGVLDGGSRRVRVTRGDSVEEGVGAVSVVMLQPTIHTLIHRANTSGRQPQ